MLHFIAPLRVQPGSLDRPLGSLLPLPPPFRRRLRCFEGVKEMELKHIDIAHLSVSPANMRAKGKTPDLAKR